MLWLMLLVYCGSAGGLKDEGNPLFEFAYRRTYLEKLDQCFCELTGRVEDCCCDVETVDSLNRLVVYPLVTSLVADPYFRFYRVNLNRQCPFWPDDSRCNLKDCHVQYCTEGEIPDFLKIEPEFTTGQKKNSCIELDENKLSAVNVSISSEQHERFKDWEQYDTTESYCAIDDENLHDLSYVDLRINPERFTGYVGYSPQRIWNAIYRENCFKSEGASPIAVSFLDASSLQGLCLEKRVFYRLVSGLHASINIHLAAQYAVPVANGQVNFEPNLSQFVRRFDAASTHGQGPSWLKNLYFTYLVVLRAVTKAGTYWEDQSFYTGDTSRDILVKEKIMTIVNAAKTCNSLFDETQMFLGTSQHLKHEFKEHFRNISRIMDCVGCYKCRLWGKLQVHGIGTALKMLFSEQATTTPLTLSRNEIVALVNVLGSLSRSIHSLGTFRSMLADQGKPLTGSDEL